jgi:hypothetical protein
MGEWIILRILHQQLNQGSGVHFYGRLYVGYDHKSTGSANSVDSIRDNGQKSRLGIKFKENLGSMSLVGVSRMEI